jgi:arginine-tRNA-protein transferase
MPSRKFRRESSFNYAGFDFGYSNWLEISDAGNLADAYTNGYLPYSGNISDQRHQFYMARSLRVRLDRFEMDKKRRYDHRAWQAFELERIHLTKEQIMAEYGEESLLELAAMWMEPRFGERALSLERLTYILGKAFLQDFLIWKHGSELNAYALIVRGDWGAHYYYVFYRNGGSLRSAPGHGYLIDFIQWAKAAGHTHAYLGTYYGHKSQYKSRGIKGVEYWDGNAWDDDKREMARLLGGDPGR